MHWSSKVPYKYKKNAITGELRRAKRIALNFDEVNRMTQDTQNMLLRILSRILIKKKDELLIPPWLFDERKHVSIRLLFSSKNENYCAYFINKLVSFTSGKVKFNVVWNTRKIQSSFSLKDRV